MQINNMRVPSAHLPIAHALLLPEQTKKINLCAVSLRFAPVLWPPEDLEVRGRKEKEERKRRKNDA